MRVYLWNDVVLECNERVRCKAAEYGVIQNLERYVDVQRVQHIVGDLIQHKLAT